MESIEDRNRIASILDGISTVEHRSGRPLLSAVVIRKDTNIPGQGFFSLAKKLGLYNGDDTLYWVEELRHVHKYWSQLGSETPSTTGPPHHQRREEIMTQTRLNATFEGRDADSRLPLEDLQRMLQFTFGQVDSSEFESRVADLLKLERQHRERLSGSLAGSGRSKSAERPGPRDLDQVGGPAGQSRVRLEMKHRDQRRSWPEPTCARLAPTRIRLSDHGDRLLAELSLADHDQANPRSCKLTSTPGICNGRA